MVIVSLLTSVYLIELPYLQKDVSDLLLPFVHDSLLGLRGTLRVRFLGWLRDKCQNTEITKTETYD